jgi:hypothetical protein
MDNFGRNIYKAALFCSRAAFSLFNRRFLHAVILVQGIHKAVEVFWLVEVGGR